MGVHALSDRNLKRLWNSAARGTPDASDDQGYDEQDQEKDEEKLCDLN